MNEISCGFWKNDKDEDFFDYLHKVKVATLSQINRDIYRYEKYKSLYKRVVKFERLGLLTQGSHIAFPKQKLVTLSRRGFDEFVGTGDERVVELKSDSIAHDVTLVDIRNRFLKSAKVINYHTENSLQTWRENLNSELRPYVEARSDGAVQAEFSTGKVCLAVEYEASRKYASRIAEVVSKYYNTDDIPAVLYICQDENIIQHHLEEERRNFTKYDARIYYKTLESFTHDQTLAFKNRDGEVLRLGNKVGD